MIKSQTTIAHDNTVLKTMKANSAWWLIDILSLFAKKSLSKNINTIEELLRTKLYKLCSQSHGKEMKQYLLIHYHGDVILYCIKYFLDKGV